MFAIPIFIKGALLIFVGAFLASSFGVVPKKIRGWTFEHIWLAYSFFGMIAVPWTMGLFTVPGLLAVLHHTRAKDELLVFLCGLGWGLGSVLFGLALKRIGVALTQAIVIGLNSAVGSLAPLVLLHGKYLHTSGGRMIIGGVIVIVLGVTLSAWAGQLKEERLKKKPVSRGLQLAGGSFLLGVTWAVLSGFFSPMLNLSFAFGAPLAQLARAHGARPIFEANAIWVIALAAGFLVNAGYCVYVISRDRSWGVFSNQYFHYWLALLMGVLWSAGPIFYGFGSADLGELAAVVGWVLLSSLNVICGNFWGTVFGEWRGCGTGPYVVMLSSIGILCAGMAVVAWGNALH